MLKCEILRVLRRCNQRGVRDRRSRTATRAVTSPLRIFDPGFKHRGAPLAQATRSGTTWADATAAGGGSDDFPRALPLVFHLVSRSTGRRRRRRRASVDGRAARRIIQTASFPKLPSKRRRRRRFSPKFFGGCVSCCGGSDIAKFKDCRRTIPASTPVTSPIIIIISGRSSSGRSRSRGERGRIRLRFSQAITDIIIIDIKQQDWDAPSAGELSSNRTLLPIVGS